MTQRDLTEAFPALVRISHAKGVRYAAACSIGRIAHCFGLGKPISIAWINGRIVGCNDSAGDLRRRLSEAQITQQRLLADAPQEPRKG